MSTSLFAVALGEAPIGIVSAVDAEEAVRIVERMAALGSIHVSAKLQVRLATQDEWDFFEGERSALCDGLRLVGIALKTPIVGN